MDKLFAVWCMYEYQSPRSTPTIRRKSRAPKVKIPTPGSEKRIKFRLLAKDDIAKVREIYEEGHKDRIIPAFKIGMNRYFSVTIMLFLFAVFFVTTKSFLVCLVAEILYSGVVFVCFHKLFNDHISRSLASDLADINQYYKTHENCTNYNDFTDNGSSIWAAIKNNDLVGFLSFSHVNQDTIELKRMGVAEQFRGNGVGLNMCQFAIQFLQATKYQRIILETTEAHKAAIRLYKKFRFTLTERQIRRWGLASINLEHYELPITRVAVSEENELAQVLARSLIQ